MMQTITVMIYMKSILSVYNWMSSMALDNKEDIKVLQDTQDRMPKILKGATE